MCLYTRDNCVLIVYSWISFVCVVASTKLRTREEDKMSDKAHPLVHAVSGVVRACVCKHVCYCFRCMCVCVWMCVLCMHDVEMYVCM